MLAASGVDSSIWTNVRGSGVVGGLVEKEQRICTPIPFAGSIAFGVHLRAEKGNGICIEQDNVWIISAHGRPLQTNGGLNASLLLVVF